MGARCCHGRDRMEMRIGIEESSFGRREREMMMMMMQVVESGLMIVLHRPILILTAILCTEYIRTG